MFGHFMGNAVLVSTHYREISGLARVQAEAQKEWALAAQHEATEAQLRLTSQEQALTSKEVRELSDSVNALTESTKRMGLQLGGNATNQGTVAEDFFYNSLLEHPQVGPFKFNKIVRNSVVGTRGRQTEYDLLLVNGDSVVVVEVKYKLHPADVDKLGQQIKSFKRDHAEFKGFKVYGALAGLAVSSSVQEAAAEHGYMLLRRKGQQMATHAAKLRAY